MTTRTFPCFSAFWVALPVALAALLCAAPTIYAAPETLCSVTDYKILNANSIAIQCGGVDTSGISGQGGIVYLGTDLSSSLPVTFTAKSYPLASNWLSLFFTSNSGEVAPVLKGQTKYTIKITLTRKVLHADGSPLQGSTSTLIDTSGTLALEKALVGLNNYKVSSHLAFKGLGIGTNTWQDCTLQVQDFTATLTTRQARCKQTQADMKGGPPGLPDPQLVGTLELQPKGNDIAAHGIPYKILELQNVLGTSMTLDPKSRLGQDQAPATKDASSYYVNGSFAAGSGSKPGWILDAKAAPPIGRLHAGWQFAPTAMANIGHNSVSGTTSSDTINLGLTEARPFELNGALQEIYASGSFIYETDREFDRDNFTGVADLRFNFKNLYSPRTVETLRRFRTQQQIAKANGITLQQSDVTPPFFGYVLDFHSGIEFGGAAVDKTVKATTGGATINLPAYPIFRIIPQIHGLLEMGRFNIDAVGTSRYLAATENTVVQLPSNSLQLKTEHGWRGYGVVTSAYSIDPAGHFSLSATYMDGFSPPKYSRVNTVQLGILLKY